jgi:hypothetical protein
MGAGPWGGVDVGVVVFIFFFTIPIHRVPDYFSLFRPRIYLQWLVETRLLASFVYHIIRPVVIY